MFGSSLPSVLGCFGSHQSLLGYRSRHCHGINFTHDGVLSEIARFRQLCYIRLLAKLSFGKLQNFMAIWSEQKSRKDKSGRRWNFCFWVEIWTEGKVVQAQRLFFWDDKKTDCGVVLFPPGSAIRYSRVKALIAKLVASPTLRKQYRRELSFPLERQYSEFGAFPEEGPLPKAEQI